MKQFYISKFSEKYYQNYNDDLELKRHLSVTTIDQGIILPARETAIGDEFFYHGGVLDSNNNFVPLSATKRHCTVKALLSGYELTEEPQYCDETVIYGGILYEHYGHVLLESISRLWYYIKHNPHHYRVVFNFVPRAYGKFKDFFDLLDIPYNEQTFITKPTRYKQVIIPEQSYYYGSVCHREWLTPINYMASKIPAGKYKKIFLSRLKLQRNPLFNEQAFFNIFKQNGYQIVYPETLSLQGQISLCKVANSLAAWEGTLALQAVFCPNGAERIILNRAIEPDVFHRFMEQLKDLPTTHIDCSLNPIPVSHIHGPWIVGFTSELQEFCSDRNWKHKGNVNFVPYRALLKFHQEWALRNPYQRVDIPFDELHYCQSKIKTKLPKTIKGIFFQILACFTFGQLRKHMRHKSKNI